MDQPVNVRDLREHLADYLGRMRAGETVVVVARGLAGHRDPFGHRLIAQAKAEDLIFMSNDRWTGHYPVQSEPCSNSGLR